MNFKGLSNSDIPVTNFCISRNIGRFSQSSHIWTRVNPCKERVMLRSGVICTCQFKFISTKFRCKGIWDDNGGGEGMGESVMMKRAQFGKPRIGNLPMRDFS